MNAVQRIGAFTVVHLDRFEGMPEELAGVRLVFMKPSEGGGLPFSRRRRLYIADADQPFVVQDAPEPTEFVAGVLAAAEQLEAGDL